MITDLIGLHSVLLLLYTRISELVLRKACSLRVYDTSCQKFALKLESNKRGNQQILQHKSNTVEHLLWGISIQRTPQFKVHKIWSLENVQISFASVTSVEGTPRFDRKEHVFWVPKPGYILTSIISGNTSSALKKWLATKRADILSCTLITMMAAFT